MGPIGLTGEVDPTESLPYHDPVCHHDGLRRTEIVTHLESITPDKLRVIDSWRNAPAGSVLQVTAGTPNGDVPLIGMHCFSEPNGSYILVLDGDDRGQLVSGKPLLGPALVITDLVNIQIKEPCPTSLGQWNTFPVGFVCERGAGSGHLYVGCQTPEQRVFVCLRDPSGTTPVGKIIFKLQDHNLFVIGRTEVSLKKPI